jgi:hypothetical protein
MGVVKWVELTIYKPDYEQKQMVETKERLADDHYVTARQVLELCEEHDVIVFNVRDGLEKEIAISRRTIAELTVALQQAQGGR